MSAASGAKPFPRHLWWLVVLYSVASLVHFSHNAEFIAFYPNMPPGISRETVYLAWLGLAAVGLASGMLWMLKWRRLAACVLALYGALGLDGFAHYTLALCSDHTLAMNLTIWVEALLGVSLAGVSLWHMGGARSKGWRADV
ncbi:MAG TPA: hypothetical protein VIL30_23090 [Ramlibacter sp.]|jgi:hypothetical protein